MVLNRKQNKNTKEKCLMLIAHKEPKSPISEQYRNVRTNVSFAAVDTNIRSIVITSSGPSEGKTTTTANLAVVFGQQGKRVLLIDADMRKPSLHKMFNINNMFGLTSVLSNQASLGECIRKTEADHVDILTCGVIPPNPAELLGSTKMEELLQQVYALYDVVIIDTPPVLAVTDAQVLANISDGIIMIVRSGKTEREAALKAKGLLENTRGKLLGVVLNAKKQKKSNYYYYYGSQQ